jgi:hypothetical protein
LALLKTKKDLTTFVDNAELRLRLVNDKLAEVELQKINVEVICMRYRPLMCWMTPISILKWPRQKWTEKTGKTY